MKAYAKKTIVNYLFNRSSFRNHQCDGLAIPTPRTYTHIHPLPRFKPERGIHPSPIHTSLFRLRSSSAKSKPGRRPVGSRMGGIWWEIRIYSLLNLFTTKMYIYIYVFHNRAPPPVMLCFSDFC